MQHGYFNQTTVSKELLGSHLDFAGFWPQQKTIIVGHQGTDPLQL